MPDDQRPSCLEMVTSDMQSMKLTEGPNLPNARWTGWLGAAFSKMTDFFDDLWALPSRQMSHGTEHTGAGVFVGPRKVAQQKF